MTFEIGDEVCTNRVAYLGDDLPVPAGIKGNVVNFSGSGYLVRVKCMLPSDSNPELIDLNDRNGGLLFVAAELDNLS